MNSAIQKAADCLQHQSDNRKQCSDLVEQSIELIKCSKSDELVKVLTCPATISLLGCGDRAVSMAVLHLVQSVLDLIGAQAGALASDHCALLALFDELVITLSDTDDRQCAKSVVRLLLSLLQCDAAVLSVFRLRYTSIRPLLRRWRTAGFALSLHHLADLVLTGELEAAGQRHVTRAATALQAAWRGRLLRRRLAQLRRIVRAVQNGFRSKKRLAECSALQRFVEEDRRFHQQLCRLRRRRVHITQLYSRLDLMSEAEATRFVNARRCDAVALIQSWWRSLLAEKRAFRQSPSDCRRSAAATLIQRWWRRVADKLATKVSNVAPELPATLPRSYFQSLINRELSRQTVPKSETLDLSVTRTLLDSFYSSQRQIDSCYQQLQQQLTAATAPAVPVSSQQLAEAERRYALLSGGVVPPDYWSSLDQCTLPLPPPPPLPPHLPPFSPLIAQMTLTRP